MIIREIPSQRGDEIMEALVFRFEIAKLALQSWRLLRHATASRGRGAGRPTARSAW